MDRYVALLLNGRSGFAVGPSEGLLKHWGRHWESAKLGEYGAFWQSGKIPGAPCPISLNETTNPRFNEKLSIYNKGEGK